MNKTLVAHTAQTIKNAIEYINKVYPNAKQLDRYPIIRNMERWQRRLEQAVQQPDPSPWIYTHLPECKKGELDWSAESKVVLIRTMPSMEHFTAFLRTWEDDEGTHREWVLYGQDGYTLSAGKVDCWMEIPS